MTFKELYTKYYEFQKDIVRYSTLKTYRDRIKYIGMFDKVNSKRYGCHSLSKMEN